MSCASITRFIGGAVSRFFRANDGNVAIIFGLAIIPLISCVGAAIDFSRANAARAAMQSALDSAALMVAKDLTSGVIQPGDISAKARSYFDGIYTNKDATITGFTPVYTPASGNTAATIKIDGAGYINSDFLQVVNFPTLSFDASSTSTWGANLLRVALVLDNTGSMNQYGKIGALRTASNNLVSQLSALASNSGDVYISVVPFGIDVNVGTSNVNASWLRWDIWDPRNGYCSGGSWPMAICLGHSYTWNHTPNTSNKSLWNGCVTDRATGYDVTSDPPSSTATNFPADQYQSCPATAILPLTYNWSSVNNTINSMTANGSTNQTLGLQWGWLSLMQQSPLNAPPESSSSAYQHIIVLFTDGLNTADRWFGDGSNTSSQVDTRMKLLCDNIKAVADPTTGKPKYTIYTVQIDTDGAGQSAVLPYCASSPTDFYMLTDPSQIAAAFASIGTSIAKLRISQ